MAIAGKVAITPGGEWSVDIAYDKLVVVTFGNNVYLSIKPSTGIEPTNEEYWMLLIENVTQEQYDNIINGTTTVGNANKLGGKSASEYATQTDITRNTPFYTNAPLVHLGSIANLDTLDGIEPTSGMVYTCRETSENGIVFGYLHAFNSGYGAQLKLHYGYGGVPVLATRTLNNGVWSGWESNATTADLANYLPKSGGEISNSGNTTVTHKSTSVDMVLNRYVGTSGSLGYLGFNGAENPVFVDNSATARTLLHTGNKPKGFYTGNGDATERTISVSGIGIGLFVIGNGCYTFISGTSAKIITDAGVESLYSGVALNLTTGTLKLSTTHVALNASGVGYTYQVL